MSNSISVLQPWVIKLTLMQQSVLMGAIRGPDGIGKFHKCKDVIRWYRRCILLSAMDNKILTSPFESGGGSFTGPCGGLWDLPRGLSYMDTFNNAFMDSRDELPLHYWTHMLHAFEILGWKHPDLVIRDYWHSMYTRMVHAFHMWPENEIEMDNRLGDNESAWRARNDPSSTCSD